MNDQDSMFSFSDKLTRRQGRKNRSTLSFLVQTCVLAHSCRVFSASSRYCLGGEKGTSESMAEEEGGGAVQGVDCRRKLRARLVIDKPGHPKQRQVGNGDSSSAETVAITNVEDNEGVREEAEAMGSDLLLHGAISVIGRRREMEDAVRVALGFSTLGDGRGYDFYGVYDGHGGSRVAEFCGERLHELIAESLKNNGSGGRDGVAQWDKVMSEGFANADNEVRLGGDELASMGSTAVVAVVGVEVVVVANCGDSRAVICRNGVAVALSEDHKPNRPDELSRIRAAGGKVIDWDGHRVLGVLATSRSIGDLYLKPFVISDPDVRVSPRTDADKFLILGSDGLWDVIPNEYACRVVRRCLKGRMKRKSHEGPVGNRSSEAAAVLTELAMARGSKDNITVIVVELNSSKFRGKSP